MPYTVARPSPVPFPRSFVVKKGSKMRSRVAASMPVPVSETVTTALPAAHETVAGGIVDVDRRRGDLSRPPHGIASRALTTRFISTWSIRAGSTVDRQRMPRERELQLDVLADHAPEQHGTNSATSVLRSIRRRSLGCGREKERS